MPKKYFKKLLPSHESIQQNRWVRPYGSWLKHHNLWHLNRRSVAGGVAVGMFGGLVPGPLQMITAGLLAILFRVNLPVAMVTTFYTNPFTIVPLYWLAYQLGSLVTGYGSVVSDSRFVVPDMNWHNWFTVMLDWMVSLGKPFAVGLPLLALLLALISYGVIRVGWRLWVMRQWHRRGQRLSFSYRPAELRDVESIVAVVNMAYRGESSRGGWTTEADLLDGQRTDLDEIENLIASDNSLILLFHKGDELIGSVHLQHGKQVAYMGMLVVKPGLQGVGLGKKFMRAAEETAIKMWGVHKILMYVITLRHELIAYYERRGYRRTGKVKDFPQDVRFGIPKIAELEIELLEKAF